MQKNEKKMNGNSLIDKIRRDEIMKFNFENYKSLLQKHILLPSTNDKLAEKLQKFLDMIGDKDR